METPHVREDEGERCGGIETAYVKDDKYEVNNRRERGYAKIRRKTMQ